MFIAYMAGKSRFHTNAQQLTTVGKTQRCRFKIPFGRLLFKVTLTQDTHGYWYLKVTVEDAMSHLLNSFPNMLYCASRNEESDYWEKESFEAQNTTTALLCLTAFLVKK